MSTRTSAFTPPFPPLKYSRVPMAAPPHHCLRQENIMHYLLPCIFFSYLSVLKNTNSRHTVQPAIPNTVLTDYIIPSKKSSPLVCKERLFIATNMFSEYFDELQHISKDFFSVVKKILPILSANLFLFYSTTYLCPNCCGRVG